MLLLLFFIELFWAYFEFRKGRLFREIQRVGNLNFYPMITLVGIVIVHYRLAYLMAAKYFPVLYFPDRYEMGNPQFLVWVFHGSDIILVPNGHVVSIGQQMTYFQS